RCVSYHLSASLGYLSFLHQPGDHRELHSFPTRRSSDLSPKGTSQRGADDMAFHKIDLQGWARKEYYDHYFSAVPCTYSMTVKLEDRKSTRLNSSHVSISYAVFCLKKKKNTRTHLIQAPQ